MYPWRSEKKKVVKVLESEGREFEGEVKESCVCFCVIFKESFRV